MHIQEIMGWLVSPNIPVGSTISFEEIEKFEFYNILPKDHRKVVICRVLTQLVAQGKISVDSEKGLVTKLDFVDFI